MVAPFILIGKKILQDLCKEHVDWDEQVSEEYRAKYDDGDVSCRCLKSSSYLAAFYPLILVSSHHAKCTISLMQVSLVVARFLISGW